MPHTNSTYDYIIAGAGCAGLSLAMHLIHSGKFSDKKILIAEKDGKQQNDRTWSFWETSPGLFEPIVYRRWKKTWFHSDQFSKLLDLDPYSYKMIRGIDFYTHCMAIIRQQPNIHFLQTEITRAGNENGKAVLYCGDQTYSADYIFNSILFHPPVMGKKEHYLHQHFKGWIIDTPKPAFQPDEATLMDFRTSQEEGTTFVYVKPFSETRALVEYTLFTSRLLQAEDYEAGLKDYISRVIGIKEYNIVEVENGIIPMTNHRFPAVDGRVVNIGTAGGQTKGSSGYTFQYIQKHSARLVNSLIKKGNPFVSRPAGPARFRFYDSVLLQVLKSGTVPGDKVFTDLFQKNKPQRVLRFLDNESSLGDELRIVCSLPTWPFLRAALKQW